MAERPRRHIAIIDGNGQLARKLADLAWPEDLHPYFIGRGEINLFDVGDIQARHESLRPAAIINAAVNKARLEPVLATQLNAEVPALLGAVTGRLLDLGARKID